MMNRSLERAKVKCFKWFDDYFRLSLNLHKKLFEYWTKKDPSLFEEIKNLEIESNNLFKDLSDEIAWDISRYRPDADHLRFFLATLISLKDIERFSDYGFSIAKIINKQRENLVLVFGEFSILKDLIDYSEFVWNKLSTNPFVVSGQVYRSCEDKKTEFIVLHKKIFSDLNYLSPQANISYETSSWIYLILVKIGRAFDHVVNIVENFYQATDPNLEDDFVSNAN